MGIGKALFTELGKVAQEKVLPVFNIPHQH